MTTVTGLGWPVREDGPATTPADARPTGLGWPGGPRVPRGTPAEASRDGDARNDAAVVDDDPGAETAGVDGHAGSGVVDRDERGVPRGTPTDRLDPPVVSSPVEIAEPDDPRGVSDPPATVSVEPTVPAVSVPAMPNDDVSVVRVSVDAVSADEVSVDSAPPERARRPAVPASSRAPFHRAPGTRVLAVANQKGGVGKTTSVVNLGAALAQGGVPTLVIDLDPQGNASTALGIEHPAGTPSIYDVLIGGVPVGDVLTTSTEFPLLQVVPATIDLAGAEIELVPMVARESRLRRALRAHLRAVADSPTRPEVILVDCPPSLGLITLNALVAARELLVPIQCEYYALEGLGQLVQTVDMVTQHLNETLEITTILLTMYDARTRLSGQVADEVRKHFGDQVLATVVPRSVRISEAPSYQQTVLTFDPTSSGALSYVEAARELAASRHAAPLAWADAGSSAPSWGALG